MGAVPNTQARRPTMNNGHIPAPAAPADPDGDHGGVVPVDPYAAYTEQVAEHDYDTPDLAEVLPPFVAGLLGVAGRLLAVLAYRDAFVLGDKGLNRRSAKAKATVFAHLPAGCDRQGRAWRLAWARCLDDLAADLEAGRAPLPRCTGERWALQIMADRAPFLLARSDAELAELGVAVPADEEDWRPPYWDGVLEAFTVDDAAYSIPDAHGGVDGDEVEEEAEEPDGGWEAPRLWFSPYQITTARPAERGYPPWVQACMAGVDAEPAGGFDRAAELLGYTDRVDAWAAYTDEYRGAVEHRVLAEVLTPQAAGLLIVAAGRLAEAGYEEVVAYGDEPLVREPDDDGGWYTGGVFLVVQTVSRASVTVDGTVVGAIGDGLLVLLGVTHSDTDATAKELARKVYELRILDDVQLAGAVSMDTVSTLVEGVPGVSRVDGFGTAKTGIAGQGQIPVTRTYPDQGHGRVSVIAIPTGTTMFKVPKLLERRWLNPGETGAVVLNQVARKNTVPDIHAGGTVQLSVGGKPTTWRVSGIAEERGGGSAVYTTADGLAAATGQPARVSQLRVATGSHDEQTRTTVADAVNKALTDAGIEVKSSDSVNRAEAISAGHLGPEITIILIIAIAMGVVGAIGLASTMSANILDRTREFGIMHAIGARPRAVRRIVVAEGVFLAITSCLAAAIPALLLAKALGAGLGNLFFSAPLPYRISTAAVGIWVVLVILGAAIATDTAATRASRITVREALNYL
jgi:hypothetical protein